MFLPYRIFCHRFLHSPSICVRCLYVFRITFFNTAVFLLILLNGCQSPENKEPQKELHAKINAFHPVSVNYARRFSVSYHGNYKVLCLYGDKNNSDTTFRYVLYARGTAKPDLGANSAYIQIPVEKVACLSSFYTGCMERLQLVNKLAAIDNSDFLTDSLVLNKVRLLEIKELSKGNEVNIEQLLILNPGLIFTYGMGNPERDMSKKVTQAGIPVAVCLEHLENSPLACAEWLKFVACFFNEEKKADSLFKQTESTYLHLKALADKVNKRPTVFTELKYGDTWFVPGGKSFMSCMLSDAGANYIWQNTGQSGSLPLGFEEVFSKAVNADYWLNLHLNNSKQDIAKQDKRYTAFSAWKEGNLFNNNALVSAKGGNAYWEKGLVCCDEVLADMIHIFHPDLLPAHSLKYYKRLR